MTRFLTSLFYMHKLNTQKDFSEGAFIISSSLKHSVLHWTSSSQNTSYVQENLCPYENLRNG